MKPWEYLFIIIALILICLFIRHCGEIMYGIEMTGIE